MRQNTGTTEPLSLSEQGRLIEIEDTISKGLRTTLDVAEGLHEIHAKRLWRSRFQSFDDYCVRRWGFRKTQGYNLLKFWEIRQGLSSGEDVPISTVVDAEEVLPESERQTRPLNGLPPGDRKAAWDRAVSDAGGQQPTGKQVEQAAEIEFYTKRHLATLPADVQLEYLQASEKVILDRAAKREAVEETEARAKRIERGVFHLRRAVAMFKAVGEDGERLLEMTQEVLAEAEQLA